MKQAFIQAAAVAAREDKEEFVYEGVVYLLLVDDSGVRPKVRVFDAKTHELVEGFALSLSSYTGN